MYFLDHIVHFVEKPELLVEQTREIGLHTVVGGKHDMWGTYNSLSYFGLTYIEYIGIFNKDLFEKSALEPFTLHETYKKRNYKNGFTRLALRTNSIEKDAEKFRSMGLQVFGPEQFSRTRPDGTVLKWKLLHFGQEDQQLDFPFIIQWEGKDEERYNELEESGIISQHRLGNLQIDEVTYVVKDLDVANVWANIFDFDMEKTDEYIILKAPNCNLVFTKSDEENGIQQIVLSGAKENKQIEIESAQYIFQK